MFFPKEIWSKIFEYDNTYHTTYADCLCDIQQNKIVNYYTRIKRHPISSVKNVIEVYVFLGIDKGKKTTSSTILYKKILHNLYLTMDYSEFVNLYNWWGKWKKIHI